MPDDDRYERLRASKDLLQRSPLWQAEGHRIPRVWIAAAYLVLDEPGRSMLIHPSTIADEASVRVDKVREALKSLAGHDILDWEPPAHGSSDLGRLSLPPEPLHLKIARRSEVATPEPARRRTALEVFGESDPAWKTDREGNRG
jgi:hypothetical protein